jgi:hypothetical protein
MHPAGMRTLLAVRAEVEAEEQGRLPQQPAAAVAAALQADSPRLTALAAEQARA